jgi:hypothetical protein
VESIYDEIINLNRILLIASIKMTRILLSEWYLQLKRLLLSYIVPAFTIKLPNFQPTINYLFSHATLILEQIKKIISKVAASRGTYFCSPSSLLFKFHENLQHNLPLLLGEENVPMQNSIGVEHDFGNRHLRFFNALLKYDYKTGDYFPNIMREQHLHLFPSLLMLSNSAPIAP